MKRKQIILAAGAVSVLCAGAVLAAQQQGPPPPMTFFVTSETGTGNLGGLAGSDARCQRLAQAAGSPATRTWHAYLSTQGANAVNARDRIGAGPWHNKNGVQIAANVADLHGDVQRDRNYMVADSALDENGQMVPGRLGRAEGQANEHDILTGSDSLGRALPAEMDATCNNWTSDSPMARAMLGHFDRSGGGNTSWNSAHMSAGCDVPLLARTGGAGRLYCFAIN